MYNRSQILVQVVSVWFLFCILMSNSYPVREILPSDGAKRVEIFKREVGAGSGGSKSGASAGPKGGAAGSNAKSSGANAKPAGANPKPEKSTQPRESKASISQGSPGPSKASASGPPKSSSNSGEPAAPAKSKEAVNGPKKASTPSDTKASDAAKDSERQKIRQQGSSGPTAPQAGSMSSQQQQQASMAQKASDSVQSQSRQADRGVTGQTDAAQRGAVSGAPQGGPVDGASRAAQQQQPVSDSSVSQQSTTQQGVGQQPVGQGGAPQAPSAGNPTPPPGPSQPQGVNGPSDAQEAPASLPGSAQSSAAAPQAPSVAAPQTGAQPAAPAPQAPVSAPQPGAQPAAAPEEAPPAVAQQSVPAGQDVATTGQAPTAQTANGNPQQGEVTGPAAMDFTQSTGAPELLMLSNTKYTMSEQGKNMPNTAEQQKLAAQAPPDSVKVEYGPYRLSQSMLNEMGYSPEDMNKMNSATPEGQKLAASAAAEALKTYGRDGFVAQQLGPATYKNFQAGTMSSEERQKFDALKSQLTERVPPPRPEISRIVAPPSIVNQRNAETQAPQPAVGSQNFFQNANPAVKSMADNAFQMNQAGPQQAPGAAPPGQPAAGAQPSTMTAQVGPQRLNSDMLKDLGYSQQEMDKMNEQTPAGQALSNSATAHAISEFGVNGFVAAQLGPEFTNRLTNNQMTGEDRKAFNDMKAQLTQGVDMSQYQGRP